MESNRMRLQAFISRYSKVVYGNPPHPPAIGDCQDCVRWFAVDVMGRHDLSAKVTSTHMMGTLLSRRPRRYTGGEMIGADGFGACSVKVDPDVMALRVPAAVWMGKRSNAANGEERRHIFVIYPSTPVPVLENVRDLEHWGCFDITGSGFHSDTFGRRLKLDYEAIDSKFPGGGWDIIWSDGELEEEYWNRPIVTIAPIFSERDMLRMSL